MANRDYDLGNAELEVLGVLWDIGPASVRDVMNHLHRRRRKIAYTTVQTLLFRLEQKAYAASDKSGLAFVYRATLSRERMQRSKAKSLVRQLYDGSAAPLVTQLIRNERFTQEEIEALHRLIEDLDRKECDS
jgi:predicted transcriptional regulator